MLLYIIRHGDPNYELDCLTEKGKKQAEALSKRLAIHGLDRIYSSPLGRAKETASYTCKRLGLEMQIEDWSREIWPELAFPQENSKDLMFMCNMPGTWFKTERNRNLGDEWYKAEPLLPKDAKAPYDDMARHADDFLARQGYVREGAVYRAEKPNEMRVALFCHGGLSSVLLPHILALPPQLYFSSTDITHTGVTIIHFIEDGKGYAYPRMLCMSDISHLAMDGQELIYNNIIKI